MSEQPDFHYFECPVCEFNSVQKAAFNGSEYCPLCAEDNDRDVKMRRRLCLETDVVEGKDARHLPSQGPQP